MKRSLTLEVSNIEGGESELKFTYEDNVITVYLDDQQICGTDYDSSFVFFCRMAWNSGDLQKNLTRNNRIK